MGIYMIEAEIVLYMRLEFGWENIIFCFIFSGTDSVFARREEGSRKLEERLSKKNKDVRICIKTRKVCVPYF